MPEEVSIVSTSKKLYENDQRVKELRHELEIKTAEFNTYRGNTLKQITDLEKESVIFGIKLQGLAKSYVDAARLNDQIEIMNPVSSKKYLFQEESFGEVVKKFNEKRLPSKVVRVTEVKWLHSLPTVTRQMIYNWYSNKGFSISSAGNHTSKLIHYIEVVEHWAYDPVEKYWVRPSVLLAA